jgi:hypothetical protein
MPQFLFLITFPLENDEFEKLCGDVEKNGSNSDAFKMRRL